MHTCVYFSSSTRLQCAQYRIYREGVRGSQLPQDRVMCGHVSSVVGTHGRASDAQDFLDAAKIDISACGSRGFIDAGTSVTKTTNDAARRRRTVYWAAHAVDLDGKCWATNWLVMRCLQRLDAD